MFSNCDGFQMQLMVTVYSQEPMRATFHFRPFFPFPSEYKSVISVFVGNITAAMPEENPKQEKSN